MNRKYTTSLLAGSVLAMLSAAPVWAASDAQTDTREPQQDTAAQQMEPGADQGAPTEDRSQPPQALSGSYDAAGDASGEDTAASSADPLYALTPAELRKMEVVDLTGKEIGKVEAVVRSREQENIQAVITSGGFLGFGAREVAVPIDQLQLKDEHLELSTSKEILESREEYLPEQYVELQPEDQPISEFSAFEAVPDEPARDNMSGQAVEEPGEQAAPAGSPD